MKRGYEIDKKRYVTRDETDKKNIKINKSLPKKEPRTVVSKPSYTLIKVNRIPSFHTQRKSFKKER